MLDQYRREIDYLRISVTDRCNLRCTYCMPAQGVPFIPHDQILSYEEILYLCRIAVKLGFYRIKLTGGEPLVRRGITSLVRQLKELDGIRQVTMTTNGILLGTLAKELSEAGLDAVNVSLDTLDPALFAKTTRGGNLELVLESISKALETGMRVKINCVPAVGQEDQIVALAKLAQDRPIDVRFIELMPIGLGRSENGVSVAEVQKCIVKELGFVSFCEESHGNGPARYFSLPGFKGKIGLIGAVSGCFCEACNRVRLTATGFLKPCLHDGGGVDLRTLLRANAPIETIQTAVEQAVFQKPARHRFEGAAQIAEEHGMSQIGG